MRNLLKTCIVDDRGFAINLVDLEASVFQLRQSNSKDVNRNVIWTHIENCARDNWERIFE